MVAVLGLGVGVAALAGCGTGKAADLFVIERSGKIPGARLTLQVIDDGFVRCNGGERRRLSGDLLLDAREIHRDLMPSAEEDLTLAPGPASVLRYRVRQQQGIVEFSDSSRAQPEAFSAVQGFTRTIAKRVCGLAR